MNKIVLKKQFSEKVYLFEIEAPLIAKSRKAGNFIIVRVGENGERVPLTIADADIERGTITIDRQMQYQDGLIKLVPLKTRNARRTVYMSQKLKEYFIRLEAETKAHAADLKAQRAQNCTYIYDVDGSRISSLELVNSLPNGKIQTVNSMKYHSRTIKTELKIDFKYHYLRHTYGTRLAEVNTPTHILCNQMGHASGKVTERYYLAVSQTGIDILVRNLNAV